MITPSSSPEKMTISLKWSDKNYNVRALKSWSDTYWLKCQNILLNTNYDDLNGRSRRVGGGGRGSLAPPLKYWCVYRLLPPQLTLVSACLRANSLQILSKLSLTLSNKLLTKLFARWQFLEKWSDKMPRHLEVDLVLW